MSGTAFQKKVWDEIDKIPYGEVITYVQIAKNIGKPKAARAVANACGANPNPITTPCRLRVRSQQRYTLRPLKYQLTLRNLQKYNSSTKV